MVGQSSHILRVTSVSFLLPDESVNICEFGSTELLLTWTRTFLTATKRSKLYFLLLLLFKGPFVSWWFAVAAFNMELDDSLR